MHEDSTIIREHATTRADIAKLHEFEHWPTNWMWPMFIARSKDPRASLRSTLSEFRLMFDAVVTRKPVAD